MADGDLRKIVENLTRENEENLYQMSTVRLVAEAVVGHLQDVNYFDRICSEFVQIFEASVCAYFSFRYREPPGWWLDAWAGSSSGLYPVSDVIPQDQEGLLEWVRGHEKPLYLENVDNDDILKFWGVNAPRRATVTLIPIAFDNNRLCAFVIINPILHLSNKNTLRFMQILNSLIKSGISSRILYKSLHDTKEEFYDLFENSSDMSAVIYPDGIIRDCNRVFREKIGLQFDPCGSRFTDLLKEDDAEDFSKCWEKLLAGEAVENIDIQFRRADGTKIETELSGNIRYLPDGRIAAVRLYLRDVTEKRYNERMNQALDMRVKLMRQRELEQIGFYVSGIAHNLQNPIHVILNHLAKLKQQGIDRPEIGIIDDYINKITDIVRNLLDKIHLERNNETVDINLNELLNSELKFLEANMFFKHEVEKDFTFDDNIPIIRGIYGDFSQAIMNVIYNALDAMQDSNEKKLIVETSHSEELNEISVYITDSGPGIPDSSGEKIFEPFFTTKKGEKTQHSGLSAGSGLGLSSSRTILAAYRGEIDYESKPGEGTTFHIRFKLNGTES